MRLRKGTLAIATLLIGTQWVAACNKQEPPAPPEPTETTEARSIFQDGPRSEPEAEPEQLAPLDLRITFPEGRELTDAARAELANALESPQVTMGGPIILRGHSDSGGTDEANLRASQARAEAVRDFLVEGGVDTERIVIIAFGEQNPIEPNALPDGRPNADGRAANRRVDINVAITPEAVPEDRPTLAESLAEELEEREQPQE